MKSIQGYRKIFQFFCLILTTTSLVMNAKLTLLIILVFTLLSGAFYCGWICPYGLIQELFGKIGNFLGIKKRKIPKFVHKHLKYLRYILLILVMFVSADFIFQILTYDSKANFQNLLLGNALAIKALGVLIGFSVLSMFYERIFCNYFCVQGGKYGLFSLFRIFTIRKDDRKCVACKKCDRTCPMHVQVSTTDYVRDPHCINCFQCVSSCPIPNTLGFGKVIDDKTEIKRYIKILLIALVLGITYLGYTKYIIKPNESVIEQEILVPVSIIGAAKGIVDGVYSGSGEGFKGVTQVEVTVKYEQISDIEIIKFEDDVEWFERAKTVILSEILEEQTVEIDSVAGATFSSEGIKNAILDALANADKF